MFKLLFNFSTIGSASQGGGKKLNKVKKFGIIAVKQLFIKERLMNSLVVTMAFGILLLNGPDVFLSPQQQESLLSPTRQAPVSPACPEGAEIPVQASFAPNSDKPDKVRFWKKSKQQWLFQPAAAQAIVQAVEYVKSARFHSLNKNRRQSMVFFVPCQKP